MGILTDRFGGRLLLTVLILFCAAPAFAVPLTGSFSQLIAVAFCLGMAGSSFAVGVGYVSKWFPPERQGGALGIYGAGNIGQSAAVFLGPLLAASIGWGNVFRTVAALLIVWGIAFAVIAPNPPARTAPAAPPGAL